MRRNAMEVKQQLSKIGQELEIMINKVVFASTNDVCCQSHIFLSSFEIEEINYSLLQGTIDDAEQFLEEQSKLLHPNHYHMTTCKHNLMQVGRCFTKYDHVIISCLQMYGRTEGYLIQDMEEEQLARKKELCLEHLEVLKAIDPDMIRLNIYAASAHFELHLPLLQVAALL